MELIKTDGDIVPIYAIPPSKWDEIICKGLIPRLLILLSIDQSKNQERIVATEAMIRESANRITPEEIEKAFLKYVKGELAGLEPRDNYLTPILFSKVISAYKQQKRPSKPFLEKKGINPQEEKDNAVQSLILSYDQFENEGKVQESFKYGFDRLLEWGILPKSGENEAADKKYHYLLKRAHLDVITPVLEKMEWMRKEKLDDTKDYQELKEKKSEFKTYDHPEIQSRFKVLVLQGFFKKVTKEQLIEKLAK